MGRRRAGSAPSISTLALKIGIRRPSLVRNRLNAPMSVVPPPPFTSANSPSSSRPNFATPAIAAASACSRPARRRAARRFRMRGGTWQDLCHGRARALRGIFRDGRHRRRVGRNHPRVGRDAGRRLRLQRCGGFRRLSRVASSTVAPSSTAHSASRVSTSAPSAGRSARRRVASVTVIDSDAAAAARGGRAQDSSRRFSASRNASISDCRRARSASAASMVRGPPCASRAAIAAISLR